jgi:ATP synthase protein I
MNNLASHLKTAMRTTLLFLSVCLIVWALFPQYRAYAAGFILGTLASAYNARHMARKIWQITRLAMEQKPQRASTGFLSRAAIVFMIVVIAIKYPQYFNLIAALIGLFFVQLATIILEIVKRKNNGES